MDVQRDLESLVVASRPPPPLGRILYSAVVHTVIFGAMATAATFFTLWGTVGLQRFHKVSSVVLWFIALCSSVLLVVGPTVLACHPWLLTTDVIVRQRSPLVKAIISLIIMVLSWLVGDSFGTAVSTGQIMIMVSIYVYAFSMVRFFKVNDDGGIVDSLAGETFGMVMTLPELHRKFRVIVGVFLALFTVIRAVLEYIEGGWRRRLAVVGVEEGIDLTDQD